LQYQHAAGKKTRKYNDSERTNADLVHLQDKLGEIARTRTQALYRAPEQRTYFLQFKKKFFERIHATERGSAVRKVLSRKGYNEPSKTPNTKNGRSE